MYRISVFVVPERVFVARGVWRGAESARACLVRVLMRTIWSLEHVIPRSNMHSDAVVSRKEVLWAAHPVCNAHIHTFGLRLD